MHLWKKYGPWLLLLLWLVFLFAFWPLPYPGFLEFCVQLLGIQSNRLAFSGLFTEAVFLRLKIALSFVFVLQLILTLTAHYRKEWFSKTFTVAKRGLNIFSWIKSHFLSLNSAERIYLIVLLVLVIVHRLVLSGQTEVIYDEAYTWLAFTSKNPVVAACFYPTSNNHILFSHLTQITKLLPFDILFNIRLSALIPNIVCILLLFFSLRKRFSRVTTWISIVVFCLSFPLVYYGFVARGYSLLLVFFTIAFFSTLSIIQNPSEPKSWIRLMFSSALGFYTIPVFLYPFVSLFGFLAIHFSLKSQFKFLFKSIQTGLLALLMTGFLYLPVFTISGVDSVLSNKFVKSLSMDEVLSGFYAHVQNSIQFFVGVQTTWIHGLLVVILAVVSAYLLAKKRNHVLLTPWFCLLIAPVLMLTHRIIPVERTWIYLMIPITFILAYTLNEFKKIQALGLIGLLLLIWSNLQIKPQMLWYDKVCMEDALQGSYFSDYFKGKNLHISTSTRMNAYFKFNKQLRSENWMVQNEVNYPPKEGEYLIQYLQDDEKDSIPINFKPVLNYEGYRLLIYREP